VTCVSAGWLPNTFFAICSLHDSIQNLQTGARSSFCGGCALCVVRRVCVHVTKAARTLG
jgi:hypothetical protein